MQLLFVLSLLQSVNGLIPIPYKKVHVTHFDVESTKWHVKDRNLIRKVHRHRLAGVQATLEEPPHIANANPKKHELAYQFCSHTRRSIQEGTFLSFTLFGPTASKKRKKNHGEENEESKRVLSEELRGCFKRITGRNVQLKKSQDKMVQVTFKYHFATDSVKNWRSSDTALGVQSLFMLEKSFKSDADKTSSEWGSRLYPIGSQFGIQRAMLETTNVTWELDCGYLTSRPRLKKKIITHAPVEPVSLAHDRVKDVPISASSDFLQALGVVTDDGKPRPGKSSKLRQIQKFVEITSGLLDKATANEADKSDDMEVIDAGCGRGKHQLRIE